MALSSDIPTDTSPAAPPLAGVIVLDFGIYRAAPHCSLLLARLGAEVIKVERITGEEARNDGVKWSIENNTKSSIAIDFRSETGQEALRRLAGKADVLIQNFRPGVMAAMNLDLDRLRESNPRLITASISAYGQTSAMKARPGYDGIMQAAAGVMYVNGVEDTPPLKFKPAIVDRTAGLHAALGILAALFRREQCGRGDSIDISLCQSAYSIIDLDIAEAWIAQQEPVRTGNRASNPPVNNAFKTSDGWIYLATGGRQSMWVALCELIGRPEWLDDERFLTKQARSRNADVIEAELQSYFGALTADEAVARCIDHHLPASRVKTVLEAARSDYIQERDVTRVIDTPFGQAPIMGDPWHFGEAAVAIRGISSVGQHTREVLSRVGGLSQPEIDTLLSTGAAR